VPDSTTKTMQLAVLLDRLERLEARISDLYGWLGEVFADDAEVSALFERMSGEEIQHRDLVRFERRVVRCDPTIPAEIDAHEADVDALLESIERFRRDNPTPSLTTALSFMLRLEDHPAELACRRAVAQVHPAMARLIASLDSGDRQHASSLRGLAERRNIL